MAGKDNFATEASHVALSLHLILLLLRPLWALWVSVDGSSACPHIELCADAAAFAFNRCSTRARSGQSWRQSRILLLCKCTSHFRHRRSCTLF